MECHIHIEEYGRSISSLLIASMDTNSKYSPFSTDPQILQVLCKLHIYLQILAKFVDLITRLHISLQSYDKYGYLHNYYSQIQQLLRYACCCMYHPCVRSQMNIIIFSFYSLHYQICKLRYYILVSPFVQNF